MIYARVDVDFYSHPKALRVGPYGRDLYVAALCYVTRHLTDGFVPAEILPNLAPGDPSAKARNAATAPSAIARRLVAAGLWDEPADGRAGWVIHDYHQRNDPAAVVRERIESDRKRKREWKRRRDSRRSTDASTSSAPGRRVDALVDGRLTASAPSPSPTAVPPLMVPHKANGHQVLPPLSNRELGVLLSRPSETSPIDGRQVPHPPGRPDLTLDGRPRAAFRTDCPDPDWNMRCIDPSFAEAHPQWRGKLPITMCPHHKAADASSPAKTESWP